MTTLNPEGSFDALKDRVSGAIESTFPYEGRDRRLEVDRVWVDDKKSIDDIRSQQEAKMRGRSWTVPVMADVRLIDKESGKELDSRAIRVANLPKVTRRYSYIVDGKERQVDNQFRLKSGVYHRTTGKGQLVSKWNAEKGLGFDLKFDPANRRYLINYGDSNIPLYPVLKAMGVGDDEIERELGRRMLTAGKKEKHDVAMRAFYKASTGKQADSIEAAEEHIAKTLAETKLRPDSTVLTLGKKFDHVSSKALLASAAKLARISRGEEDEDNREHLFFKDALSTEDFIEERLQRAQRDIKAKLSNNIDKKGKRVREVISPDLFDKPIRSFFTSSQLAQMPEQINPLEFVSGQTKTTVMGEGGIKTTHTLTDEVRLIDPTHLGFLDPIQTPEGDKTGITLQLPLGALKKGKKLYIRAYNTKTGKMENVDAHKAHNSTMAYPDQFSWKGGKPTPDASGRVAVSGPGGELKTVDYKDVDYVLRSPKALFGMSSNLIPFLQNNQGVRAMTASRQQEQAVPLVDREQPQVQVKTESGRTFEQTLGRFNAHHAPVAGKVIEIKPDAVVIRGKDRKKHEVQLYDHFPLNEASSVLHSNPVVKVGDEVKSGQLVADSNFTKGGTLALGKNLRVAYLPYKGYNFEDGIVVSETGAQKLTSQHMHRKHLAIGKDTVLKRDKFRAYSTPDRAPDSKLKKLDDDGIIRVGETVTEGDILVASLKKPAPTSERRALERLHKSLVKDLVERPLTWDNDTRGKVIRVVKTPKGVDVHVATEEPARVGDKLVGRHGNKGVITAIIPDHEMPRPTEKGSAQLDVLLNPAGIPGRINLGQVLETAASKLSTKRRPYVVNNFAGGEKDYISDLKKELAAAGVKDTEPLVDPQTGAELGDTLTGDQYMLKLKHQVTKKSAARSGGTGYGYDVNRVPKGGGAHGAQAMDALGMYAMLAHGAKANIREMATYKTQRNDELWDALQSGEPLPPPTTSFAYDKFQGYMNVMGINPTKRGSVINLSPLTDAQVVQMSNGALPDAGLMFQGKDMKPERGGLFDPRITGGPDGTKWSHIELAESMPNPVFERAILTLTGLTNKKYQAIMAGKDELDGKSGPEAIREKLKDIDVDKRLRQLRRKMEKTDAPAALAKMRKESRYLEALQANEMTPSDAYLMSVVPVLPPSMRPVSVMDGGDLNTRDINGLYKYLAISNRQLKEFDPGLPEGEKRKLQAELYDDLRALTMTGKNINKQQYRGVMETMKGVPQPKDSFFQKNLISRKQDLSMRSIIIPEPAMGLDEVGIPYSLAKETYKPFIVRKLRTEQGFTPLEGQKEVEKDTELARRTLERVLDERPVLLKRDPVLHKFGIMAFQPKVVEGKAIRIHPLVTGGYNADFDGDAMSAYVPLTHEAVSEAHKMFPSRNLFSPTSGRLMYQPGHEAQLGLYRLTKWGKRTGHEFKSTKEAAKEAAELGLGMTDVITVKGKETTLGRLLIDRVLPKGERGNTKLLHTPSYLLDKGEARKLLTSLAEKHPNDFGDAVNQLKDLGNNYAYQSGFSVSLRDFTPQRNIRDRIVNAAHKEVAAIHKRRDISEEKRERLAAEAYQKATNELTRILKPKLAREKNNALELVSSGARGDWDQLRQIVVAPMLIKDAADRPIPIPITKSYAEGLDTASYFTTMQGARKTMIQKTKETAKPGALTKDIVNSAMNMLVIPGDAPDDAEDGIFLDTESREIIGRFLSKPAKLRTGETLPRNTELTPEVITRIRNAGTKKVSVRSPLRSAAAQGIYARDYGTLPGGGLPEPGTNIGVIAAQALGEPATQLSMKAFHHGGVASTKGKVTDSFTRVENLLQMPSTLPDSATLAGRGGRISKIEKDRDVGGLNVWVEDKRHYVPEHLVHSGLHLRKGLAVKRGDRLSAGPINPHELLPLTNINTVRNYLTDEVHTAYKDSGVQRRNAEAVIRAITNLGVVRDPAGDPTLLKGDLVSVSQMEARNRKSKKPVAFRPVLRGVNQTPLDMQTDWMARMQYQRLQDTVVDAALKNWGSDIHGMHPVPGMAYGAEFGKPPLGVTSFKY